MRNTSKAALIAFCVQQLYPTMVSSQELDHIISISGKNYLAIQSAISEFSQHAASPQIDKYTILVLEQGESLIVLFSDPDRPKGLRGGSPNIAEFEVELHKRDLNVIRSNFVR